jgi:hypothetical protein
MKTKNRTNRIYTVYEIWDLEKIEPFYVGKTFVGSLREQGHLREAKNPFYPVHYKLAKMIANETSFEFRIVFESLIEDEAFLEEIRLIKFYGRRDKGLGPLLNISDGGDGPRGFSEEQRRRWSEIRKGRPSPHRGKRYKHKNPSPKKGKPWTQTQRDWYDNRSEAEIKQKSQRSSESHMGQQQSEEWRKEHSERMMGENNPNFGKVGYYAGKVGPWAGKSHPNKGRKKGPDGKLYYPFELFEKFGIETK